MFILGILIAIVTFGFGLIFVWIGCIIWAIIAANSANKKMASGAGININTNFGNPISQQQPPLTQNVNPQPQVQQQYSQQAEQVAQTVVQEAPKTISQQPSNSFDIAEWFGKNFKKVIIAAIAIIVLGGGGYFVYKNYLIDDPVRDGLKAAKMNCELAVNNTDKVIELRKEYMVNFNSYNFKSRKEAVDKFDDMCKGQLADYNTNFTMSRDFYIQKRNTYMIDNEKLAQFDASYNQYTCVGGKDYELDQLLNKQWDLINTTFPQQNNVAPQQVAPSTVTNNSSSTAGNFPQASERLLTSSDLSGMSKQDLKIMRNEIFARHGYIFKTAEMKSYFANQSWYSGQYDDVTSMLSNIEKQNIELVKKYE